MKKLLQLIICLSFATVSTTAISKKSQYLVVDKGTTLSFRTTQKINYKETPTGTTFRAKVSMDVINDDGDILIPEGAILMER